MSLRFALLGLLSDRPSSGYDLTQRFAAGIGTYAWDAKHSQIYPELKRLLADDLIEVAEEGARGRKTYAITSNGSSALRDWLLTPPAGQGGVRNEYVLRLFLLPVLDPDEAKTILTRTIQACEGQIKILIKEREELSASGATAVQQGALAAQYGIGVYQATIDWARWAIKEIDAAPDSRSGT
jgi:PadR family transcriptional regulator, regulatory protein AphA